MTSDILQLSFFTDQRFVETRMLARCIRSSTIRYSLLRGSSQLPSLFAVQPRRFSAKSESQSAIPPPPPASQSAADSKSDIPDRDPVEMTQAEKIAAAWELAKPRVKTVGLLTALALAGTSLLTGVWHTLEYFASLSFANVGAVAFATGVASTVAVLGAFTYTRSKFLIMRPERMLRLALKRVRSDPVVQQRFGPDVTLGRFQAYAYASNPTASNASILSVFKSKSKSKPSSDEAAASASAAPASASDASASSESSSSHEDAPMRSGPFARLNDYLHAHQQLQIIFEVRGVFGKGYVAAELALEGGRPVYRSLTVTHAKTFERLLLEGEPQPAFRAVLNNSDLLQAVVQTEEMTPVRPEAPKTQEQKYTH